jgi:hypothetical protein
MKTRFALILMVPALLLAARPLSFGNHVQEKNEQKEVKQLIVISEPGKPTIVSAENFAKMRRQTVKAKDHSGTLVTYEGVALADILGQAGVPLGKELKGPRLANCLLVEAADGYRVVFALPEIDPAMTDNIILLADRRDGQALDAKHGPYQLVVPHEKRQSRWVRQVTKMSVVQVEVPRRVP